MKYGNLGYTKKHLLICGIIFFTIGGIMPVFLNSFTAILAFRALFGVGLGLVQVLTPAITSTYFQGDERAKVLGYMNSFSSLGMIIMSVVGGYLGTLGWNRVFYVHLIAILSLLGAIFFIPKDSHMAVTSTTIEANTNEFKPTLNLIKWIIIMFLLFVSTQIFSNVISYLMVEQGLGNSSESGFALSIFGIGGFIMGFFYGRVKKSLQARTLSLGFLLISIAFLIIGLSTHLWLIYCGAFIYGLGISICVPSILGGASSSVNATSVGMAVAIVTASQNLGQATSANIVNFIINLLGQDISLKSSQLSMLIGAIILFTLSVISFIDRKLTAS